VTPKSSSSFVSAGGSKNNIVLNESGPLDILKRYKVYGTGGLADFTGPAWLDGTRSNPELILNARDT